MHISVVLCCHVDLISLSAELVSVSVCVLLLHIVFIIL